jgi:hypothetical protein
MSNKIIKDSELLKMMEDCKSLNQKILENVNEINKNIHKTTVLCPDNTNLKEGVNLQKDATRNM